MRRAILAALMTDLDYLCACFAGHAPGSQRMIYRALAPFAKGMIAKGNGIAGPISIRDGAVAAREALDFVESQRGGNPYLAGDSFSGADLANLVNEAALMAARYGRRFVTMEDFENAKDKVMMGVERRSMVLTPEQKEKTAWHEAGHAIVGMAMPKCDPVYKATIIPRGGALGMVVSLPEMDRLNMHKDEAKQRIAMTMAGKAAEIIKYGEEGVSNGPAGDIMQASQLARAMVMRWGMSDLVGSVDYAEAHEGYQGNAGGFSVSAHTKEMIEQEVRELIDEGYVVIAPEYRGSTGYGQPHYDQIDYGASEIDDSYAARNWAVENLEQVDKERVGIIGWSHGGLHALMNVFRWPNAYRAAYAGVPVSDLVQRMGYKSQGYRDIFAGFIGKQAVDDPAEYRRRSPVSHVARLETPLLVHTTTNDEDVNVMEVEHLIAALQAAGKKFEHKVYQDAPGGHSFNRLDTKLARESRREVYAFLARHLKR